MDQSQLKTSWKTRIIIGIIGFLMLFSTVAVYALIVLSSENSKKQNDVASKELEEVQKEKEEKGKELESIIADLSKEHLDTLKEYRSRIKSYNAKSVDNAGLKYEDLKKGNGEEITAETKYYSYYIGWCADESVFESSFEDFSKPTALRSPLYTEYDGPYIAGWEEGVIGMKVGGVREIDIPAELAYGDKQEICGSKNSPLKFIIYVVDPGKKYKTALEEYYNLLQQEYVLYYSQNQDLLGGSSSEGETTTSEE